MTRPSASAEGAALLAAALALAPGLAAAQETAAGFLARARSLEQALPPAPACQPARADGAGRVASSPLPGMVEGAARGTTGGLERRLLLVTSAEDADPHRPEPGSLRWAVETARAEGGGWISFAPALEGVTIRLGTTLRLPSDTTLDGGCARVTLLGPARSNLLLLRDVGNVIVARLSLTKEPYLDLKSQSGDAIGLMGATDRVAILHNALARCGDGCVDIVRRGPEPQPMRVTVAFNRFADHNKVMLIGTLTCNIDRAAPGCDRPLAALDGPMRPNMRITLQANVFEGTSQRHPKVVSHAAVHAVNNLVALSATTYADGRASAVYGAAAASGGLLLAEGDILLGDGLRPRIGIGPISATREGPEREGEQDGAVAVERSVGIGGARLVPAEPALAEAARTEVSALDPRRDPARLAACLLRLAGPAGASLSWPAACESGQARAAR